MLPKFWSFVRPIIRSFVRSFIQIIFFLPLCCRNFDRSFCRRTSQVIGPTCTCPCLKDLRQLCVCTKQLNRICPSAPRTPDKRLTAKIAGLSKYNSHTNTCSGNKFFITKWLQVTTFTGYNHITIYHRSDYKRIWFKNITIWMYKTFISFKIHASLSDSPQ
jgi:hypothetical protein